METGFVKKTHTDSMSGGKGESLLVDILLKRSEKSSSVLILDDINVSAYPIIASLLRKGLITRINAADFFEPSFNLDSYPKDGPILWIDAMEYELLGNSPKHSDLIFKFSEASDCKGRTVLINLKEEILGVELVRKLEFLCDTVLRTHRILEGGSVIELKVLHRKAGGRLRHETCFYQVDLEEFKKIQSPLFDVPPSMAPPVPHPGLTFNTQLTASQAKARAAVELPHMRAQTETPGEKPAAIYDKKLLADDHDEEDPDDDLDV